MKMKFLMAVKIFIIGLCGVGLLVTYFSFPSVKNVWAQMDMEDLMESIQESIQEEVKQTTKQQVRQETTAVITETIVEPTVATSGDATTATSTTTTTTTPTTTPTTTSCDITGSWLDNTHGDICNLTQSGSSFSGTCTDDFDHTDTVSGTLTNSSACTYSYSLTETWSDEFGSCTETLSGSATLSSDGNTITWSETLVSHSGTATDCGVSDTDSGTLTKQ